MSKPTSGSLNRARLTTGGSSSGRVTELYTLGGLRVVCQGVDETPKLGPRHMSLLVYLYHERRPLHPTELIELLGKGQDDEKELDRLNKAISWLRNNITGVDISSSGETIETYGGVYIDTREVDAAIDGGDPEHVAALYVGEFLEGFESGAPAFDEWAQRERGRLRRAWGNATQASAREAERRSDWRLAALWWKVLVARAPMRGEAVAGLLQAYGNGARWEEATAAYADYASRLTGAGVSKVAQPVANAIAKNAKLKEIAQGIPLGQNGGEAAEAAPGASSGADAGVPVDPAEPAPSPAAAGKKPGQTTPPGAKAQTKRAAPPKGKAAGKPSAAPAKPASTAGAAQDRAADQKGEAERESGAKRKSEPARGRDDGREGWQEFVELPGFDVEMKPAANEATSPPRPREVVPSPPPKESTSRPASRSRRLADDDPLREALVAAREYASTGTPTGVKHEVISVRKPWTPVLKKAWEEILPWLVAATETIGRGFLALVALAGRGIAGLFAWTRSVVSSRRDRRRERKRTRASENEARAAALVEKRAAEEKARAAREKARKEEADRERAAREKAALEKAELEKAARQKTELEKAERESAELEKAQRETAGIELAERERVEAAKQEERAARERAERERIAREKAERERAERDRIAAALQPEPLRPRTQPVARKVAGVVSTVPARGRAVAARPRAASGGAARLLRRYWYVPLGAAAVLLAVFFGPSIAGVIRGVGDADADQPASSAPAPSVGLPKVSVPRVLVKTPTFVETSVSKIGRMLSGSILASSGQWLLIADVEVSSSDEGTGNNAASTQAAALAFALEAEFSQAHYFSVVPRERALSALAQQGGAQPHSLPVVRALSLAGTEGYAAVIAARVKRHASALDSVEMRVLGADGDTLYGVAAGLAPGVSPLEALSGLGQAVRRRLGEPQSEVDNSLPSTQLLTGSLAALEAYARARTQIYARSYGQAVSSALRATALDSTFAMAYRTLAEAYALQGSRPRARAALETAWELSGRLGERERYRLLADRLAWDSQYADAVMTYDELFKRYRDDAAALRSLGIIQRKIGVRGGGIGNLSVAYALDPHDWPRLSQVARFLGYRGPLPAVDSLAAAVRDGVP